MTPPSAPPGSNSSFDTPGGPFFVLPSGTIQRQSNPVAALALWSAGAVGFPTDAAAKAWASTQTHNPATAAAKAAADAAKKAVSGILPVFTNTRDLVVRTVKVLIGIALIVIGINSLMRSEGIDIPKPPP